MSDRAEQQIAALRREVKIHRYGMVAALAVLAFTFSEATRERPLPPVASFLALYSPEIQARSVTVYGQGDKSPAAKLYKSKAGFPTLEFYDDAGRVRAELTGGTEPGLTLFDAGGVKTAVLLTTDGGLTKLVFNSAEDRTLDVTSSGNSADLSYRDPDGRMRYVQGTPGK